MCMDGEVQLVGGDSKREGRVEMCYNGQWGRVCTNNGWDEMAANIVCSQFGYNKSSKFNLCTELNVLSMSYLPLSIKRLSTQRVWTRKISITV